jgi:hypothetical protein
VFYKKSIGLTLSCLVGLAVGCSLESDSSKESQEPSGGSVSSTQMQRAVGLAPMDAMSSQGQPQKQPPAAPQPATQPAPQPAPSPGSTKAPFGSRTPQQKFVPPTLNAPENRPQDQRVRAQVGVGAQGRSLDNESGIIVTPAKTYFTVREKAVFQIQIPQALQLFQGLEGRKPKSHDEFMSRIVEANNIQLPRLPDGQRYEYDPQSGELMVVRPRQ